MEYPEFLYSDPSNSKLIKLKLDCLKKASEMNIQKPNTYSCTYLGIGLRFHSESNKLLSELEALLPESWKVESNDSFDIKIFSPEQFGYTLFEWSDEGSQNCQQFDTSEGHVFLQRDFASIVKGKNVTLICEDSVGDGFYNFLRSFISKKVNISNQAILHSSAIVKSNGKAVIFIGHSGAGKTTITSFAENRLVLGDDMILTGFENDSFYVSPAAIGGAFIPDVDYDAKYEVDGIYWLVQSDENEVRRLSPLKSKSKLMASFANLFWEDLSEKEIEFFLQFSNNILNSISVYELEFTKSSNFWSKIENE